MERKRARDWYWWLWLSPLLTIPTFVILYASHLADSSRGNILVAVLGSALWHLVLLGPIRNKEYPFVRWHGRQALVLAGVRTVIPLAFGVVFGESLVALLFVPVQLAVWFGGTLWGQLQAARGDCSLMRWFGQEELLSSIQEADVEVQVNEVSKQDVRTLIEIVRFSRDPVKRERAVKELTKLGMVEPL